ncbi:HDOD domain-containing protein [Pseudomonas brenneri]|jgi:HD-like signal output (HDOD) protein|uniref:HD-like signal output (HDOD) domain, no enzymatic activity n=1 Tax=Pseudomonas brenneri TaxID=129817 RepID=A0A5B2UPZ5_9PSED|nr:MULTISPECIES: HDOD domain-containing protein [Pseudomonas]KAA2227969.1 HDOD domain-containing protein [Pseudomonas brenneri]TWR78743.1 HDOD domain-containing protein [Pseudomonas brenneri]CRM74820.1 HDOD domain protein [Pseudomonas sp. 25 R 14]SDU83949.1 HD-like signal output (HDOD) domain, no enzymatic activity [Pseudomonas brenneri]GGL51334.1 HDOD domain-containing protein [Pseudomonas brenneri]
MNKLAEKVQQALVMAIDNDDLVLPTLPEVALKIRQAAEDPEISISHLSKVIGRDTALTARLIKVVNSPLLRASQEVTDLHTAITRLGTNYSSNLAIGLVMEQIFHARSDVVEQKMRDVWRRSLEVAGVCYALCRNHSQLKPDQAALGGLVHQIGVLPILTYAEDHYELLSDPVSLNHVIDNIHPLLGDKLLRGWDFPEMLVNVPAHYQDLERDSASLDYVDLVQVAVLYCHKNTDHPLANAALSNLPALKKLRIDPLNEAVRSELDEARSMFY